MAVPSSNPPPVEVVVDCCRTRVGDRDTSLEVEVRTRPLTSSTFEITDWAADASGTSCAVIGTKPDSTPAAALDGTVTPGTRAPSAACSTALRSDVEVAIATPSIADGAAPAIGTTVDATDGEDGVETTADACAPV